MLYDSDQRYEDYVREARHRRSEVAWMLLKRSSRAIGRNIARVAEHIGEWRRRRGALAALRALDDRTLKDIGMHRSQIRAHVLGIDDRPDRGSSVLLSTEPARFRRRLLPGAKRRRPTLADQDRALAA